MHKHFITLATAAVLCLGLTQSVAQAQDQQAPPADQQGPPQGRRGGAMGNPDQEIQRLRQQLKLTDDQVSQIRPILADAQKQIMALRSDSTVAPEDRRGKMMSIRQDSVAKIRGVLTDSQKPQYDELIAKRQQMMQQRQQEQPSGNAGAPPNQ